MITPLPRAIPQAEVLRLLGYPADRAAPERVRNRLDALTAEAGTLLEPRGVRARFPTGEAGAVQLPLPWRPPQQAPDRSPGAIPPDVVSGFAIGLVTIGPRLEERSANALRDGDATGALLLDAIGSAAAEAAAEAMSAVIAATAAMEASRAAPAAVEALRDATAAPEAPTAGASVADAREDASGGPCRISPGYGGWPLSAQEAIFARLPHDSIGVRLLPSMLMVPRKSITFALWFDPAGRVIAGRGGCAGCDLDACPRRDARGKGDRR